MCIKSTVTNELSTERLTPGWTPSIKTHTKKSAPEQDAKGSGGTRGKKFPLICSAATSVNITGGWENTETPLSPRCSRIRPGTPVLWDPAAQSSSVFRTNQVRCDPARSAFFGVKHKTKVLQNTCKVSQMYSFSFFLWFVTFSASHLSLLKKSSSIL